MAALTDFVGTWIASRDVPYSNHIFTPLDERSAGCGSPAPDAS